MSYEEFTNVDGTCIITQAYSYIYRYGTTVEFYGYFYVTTKATRNQDILLDGSDMTLTGSDEPEPINKNNLTSDFVQQQEG